jgi:type I restriction enzyme, R subunit
MSRQSEQILEEQLIGQLQKLGYSYIVINSEKDLLLNLKRTIRKTQ